MPEEMLARFALLTDLKLLAVEREFPSTMVLSAEKRNPREVCPRCAVRSWAIYDRRNGRIKDNRIRHSPAVLNLRKRRFFCKPCKKLFTEPVVGVSKGSRFTERFKRAVVTACERYSDMKSVKKQFRCFYTFTSRSTSSFRCMLSIGKVLAPEDRHDGSQIFKTSGRHSDLKLTELPVRRF